MEKLFFTADLRMFDHCKERSDVVSIGYLPLIYIYIYMGLCIL